MKKQRSELRISIALVLMLWTVRSGGVDLNLFLAAGQELHRAGDEDTGATTALHLTPQLAHWRREQNVLQSCRTNVSE